MDPELYRKAANEGNLDFVRWIIEKVGDKNPPLKNLEGTWDNYRTPLHIAASHGHLEICRLIMDHLEDKNPKND